MFNTDYQVGDRVDVMFSGRIIDQGKTWVEIRMGKGDIHVSTDTPDMEITKARVVFRPGDVVRAATTHGPDNACYTVGVDGYIDHEDGVYRKYENDGEIGYYFNSDYYQKVDYK